MKSILSIFVLVLITITCSAQNRQVEISVDYPIKSKFRSYDMEDQTTSNQPRVGGKLYQPLTSRLTLEADLTYGEASNFFLNPPTDNVNVSGKMWLHLTTTGNTRPFVYGGVHQSMFVDQLDGTQAIMGFGINHTKPSGFSFIPSVEFTTDDMTDKTGLGREFTGKVRFIIPFGSTSPFSLNLTPWVKQFEVSQNTKYVFDAGVTAGVGFRF